MLEGMVCWKGWCVKGGGVLEMFVLLRVIVI